MDTDQRYSARGWGELKFSPCVTSQAFCPRAMSAKRGHIFLIFTKAMYTFGTGGSGVEEAAKAPQLHRQTILENGKGVSYFSAMNHVLFVAVTPSPLHEAWHIPNTQCIFVE